MLDSPRARYVAGVLGGLNLVGAGYAIAIAEPVHAAVHTALALVLGWWATRRRSPEGDAGLAARLDALEIDVSRVRQELGEAQERLDFTERMLAQGRDAGRIGRQP